MIDELKIAQKLKDDFEHYAKKCLKISTVDGGDLVPFELNKAQKYIHQKIEQQLKETGKVRAIILKGRQEGCSTYVEGRFYWKATHRHNVNVFILTHSRPATRHLFNMVQRFHDNNHPFVKPSVAINNANELDFDKLGSGYRVSTAGSKGVGRSSTLQYFHGSEVAFWANDFEHISGIFQAVADKPNTEIILESTPNGRSGLFYELCMTALNDDESEYQLIFIPWYWREDYRKKLPTNKKIEWSNDELKYKEKYKLDFEQLYWRRNKIKTDYSNNELGFRKEYPASIDEAFEKEVEGALWKRENIKHISEKEYNNSLWNDELDEDENINKHKVIFTVLGYDPAMTGNKTSDEHGVIIASLLDNNKIYILNDSSAQLKPNEMVPLLIRLYYKYDVDRIRVEVNNGGDWIPDSIAMVDENVFVLPIYAKKNKKLRAGPVAQAYNNNRIIHVGHHIELEDEMTHWIYGIGKSPNRIDALVYACLDCLDLDDIKSSTDIMVSHN